MIKLSYFRRHQLSMLRFLFVLHLLVSLGLLTLFFPSGLRWSRTVFGPLLAFSVFGISLLYLVVYLPLLRLIPGRSYRWLIVLEGIRYTLLVVDLLLFQKIGSHLFSRFVLRSMLEFKLARTMGLNFFTAIILLTVIAGIFFLSWAAVWLWYKISFQDGFERAGETLVAWAWGLARWGGASLGKVFSVRLGKVRFVELLVWIVLIPSVGYAYIHASKNTQRQFAEYIPLYSQLNFWSKIGQQNSARRTHLRKRFGFLRYPRKKASRKSLANVKRPNLVMFSAESLRIDMFNPRDMPLLSAWIKKQPVLVSRSHYSGGHQTWEGFFSMMYSLYGHHRDTFRNREIKPYTLQLLKKLGYRLVAATAANYDFRGFRSTMKPFDRVVNLERLHATTADKRLHKVIREEVKAQKAKPPHKRQPLFFLVFYMSTHYPFTFPQRHATFRPFLPAGTNQVMLPPDHQKKLWNRYRNSVRFLDELMTKTLTWLYKELPDEKLAWAFIGDHGEEFWDHGLFGHGARRLNNARVQTPLVMRLPGMKKTKHLALSSHVDIFPTWFGAMGVPLQPRQYSDGVDLMKTKRKSVFVNGYNFPDSPIFVIATPKRKIFARRDEKMRMEVNEVLDAHDRRVSWHLGEFHGLLQQHRVALDWFYPGYQLFHSSKIINNKIAGYPFPNHSGPVRTASRPNLFPWQRLGELSRLVTRKAPKVQYKLGVRVGELVELVGYNLKSKKVRLGDPVVLEFVYRCLKKPSRDWRIFHHFKFKQHPGFKNITEIPALGRYPVWRWKPGEYIRDPHRIATHPNWRPGSAEIRMGLWNRRTRRRAAISGGRSKGNSALVTRLKLTHNL